MQEWDQSHDSCGTSAVSGFRGQVPPIWFEVPVTSGAVQDLQGSCADRRARGSTVLRACCAGFWATGRVAVGCVCVLGALVLAAPLAHGRKGGGAHLCRPPFPRFSGFFSPAGRKVDLHSA